LSWETVSTALLDSKSFFDDWHLTIPGNSFEPSIPRIIKLTLKLIENSLAGKLNKIIIVYPERMYLPSMTVVLKAISDIISGYFDMDHILHQFHPDQKLKIDNLVCKFISIEKRNGKEMIHVKFADINWLCPMEKAPFFQKTDTSRRLSKFKGSLANNIGITSVLDVLEAKKTFVNDSVYYISSVRKFTEIFSEMRIKGKKLTDLLLLGKINADNKIDLINTGKLNGNPALLFSENLDFAYGNFPENISSVFIDIHNDAIVNKNLDAFDKLIRRNIPIIVISDTVNSFNFTALEERNFVTLRWDSESIIPGLYSTSSTDVITRKIYNCGNREVHYERCENREITRIFKNLYKLKRDMEGNTQFLTDLYWELYNIIVFLLRNIITIPSIKKDSLLQELDKIENDLKTQRYSISVENMGILTETISDVKIIIDDKYVFAKNKKAEYLIANSVFDNIVIIIPDNEDKNTHAVFWNNYIENTDLTKTVKTMYVQEYFRRIENIDAEIIVCGWFSKKKMRNIIFSNNAPLLHILLNKIEIYWKQVHSSEWDSVMKNESRKLFDKNVTTLIHKNEGNPEIIKEEAEEDIDIIEDSIQEYKFRKYISHSNQNAGNISVEVVPLVFAGGCFALYKISSKIITVTEIINNISDNQREVIKPASEIETGDFVVIRETEKSLIHELADNILEKKGKKDYRELSGIWKKGLNEKRSFGYSAKDLHKMIKKAGSTIGLQAFRVWIDDDDFIAPQDKENLRYIADALEDKYLLDNIDKIDEICKYVRNTHRNAGKFISGQLKTSIAKTLGDMPKVRGADIWDPLDIKLDELGKVKILRVTDIGNTIEVDVTHTNKLLTGNENVFYGRVG
jgi:hypothetical protein